MPDQLGREEISSPSGSDLQDALSKLDLSGWTFDTRELNVWEDWPHVLLAVAGDPICVLIIGFFIAKNTAARAGAPGRRWYLSPAVWLCVAVLVYRICGFIQAEAAGRRRGNPIRFTRGSHGQS